MFEISGSNKSDTSVAPHAIEICRGQAHLGNPTCPGMLSVSVRLTFGSRRSVVCFAKMQLRFFESHQVEFGTCSSSLF